MANKRPVIEGFGKSGISPDPLKNSVEGYWDSMCGDVFVYDLSGNLLRKEKSLSYDEAEQKRRQRCGKTWSIIHPAKYATRFR